MPVETPASCPVCQATTTRLLEWAEVGLPQPSQLRSCEGCGAAFFFPFPEPDHCEGSPLQDKFALEHGSGIGCMLETLLPLRGLPAERVLEIGGGYGFLLDAAGSWCGARGRCLIEPAPWATVFDHPVIAGYFPDDLPAGRYDLILASEVLEHVPEPRAFLAALIERLEPGGRALLTTPNAAVLAEEDALHRQGILSPGQHMVLFSPQALAQTIRSLGAACRIEERGGGRSGRNSLVCFIARDAAALQPVGPVPVASSAEVRTAVADYYRARLASPAREGPTQRWLRAGLLARLIELEVSSDDARAGRSIAQLERCLEQDYGLDAAAQWALPDTLAASVGRDLLELVPDYPCFLGRSSYFRAMWRLNHGGDPVGAARLFSLSLRLLLLEQQGFAPWFCSNRPLVALAARHSLIATRRGLESLSAPQWRGLARLAGELARPAARWGWEWLRSRMG